VTINTHVMFDYTTVSEAEGHALCVEDDLNEDPFGSAHVRCIMLAGKQFTRWNNVKRINLALANRDSVEQSHNTADNNADALLAVDGNKNTFTNTGPASDPWWKVTIEDKFIVTDIIIYSRFDMYTERLLDYTVTINHGTTEVYSNRFIEEHASQMKHIKDIIIDETQLSGTHGLEIIIQLNTGSSLFPHMIGEVEVYGSPRLGMLVSYKVPVGDLFRSLESNIRYIAFVQDNDSDPLVGESVIEDVTLFDDDVGIQGKIPFVSFHTFVLSFCLTFIKHIH